MKKILLLTIVFSLSATGTNAMFDYLSAPNEGNINFAPLKQYEFEKHEALDFINNSEQYAEKREKKEKFLDYQEGKIDVPPMMNTQFNLQSKPGSNNMQFIKDENGKLRIKSSY